MAHNTNRRDFLKSAAVTGSAVSLHGCNSAVKLKKAGEYPARLPEPLPKGLEYTLKLRDMVINILEEDTEKINRAADICAEAVASGKKVYYSILGHNSPQCILETKPGRPSFLIPLNPKKKSIEKEIEEGDVLITVRTGHCSTAIKKGAKAIGILMPFQPQKTRGQGIVHIDYTGSYMEDISDVCIWDRTPFTVGIMDFDLMPWKSVSAHGAMDGIILGFILSATVDRLLEKGIKVEPS